MTVRRRPATVVKPRPPEGTQPKKLTPKQARPGPPSKLSLLWSCLLGTSAVTAVGGVLGYVALRTNALGCKDVVDDFMENNMGHLWALAEHYTGEDYLEARVEEKVVEIKSFVWEKLHEYNILISDVGHWRTKVLRYTASTEHTNTAEPTMTHTQVHQQQEAGQQESQPGAGTEGESIEHVQVVFNPADAPTAFFTAAQLAKYDGSDPSLPILLAFKGKVYDVTQGAPYYGRGGVYHKMAGKDATRAFATGDPKNDLVDNLDGLSDVQLKSLEEWGSFYEHHETYTYVGNTVA